MGAYQLKVITFFWASALIISANSASGWLKELDHHVGLLLASGFAVALLIWRSSLPLLRWSVVAYLLAIWEAMPNTPNHRVVLAFAGVAILAGTARRAEPSRVISSLRWLTIVVYLFAVLAKLNTDYLRADVSCASRFFVEALQLHGLSAASALTPTPSWAGYWSFLIELLIVVLLIPSRTRSLGVVVGIGFHLCLATDYVKYFANFSAAMFLLLSSWLSEDQCQRLVTRYFQSSRRIIVAGIVILFGTLVAHASGMMSLPSWVLVRYAVWVVFGFSVLVAVARATGCTRAVDVEVRRRGPSVVLVALAVLNGLCPYLGIKTRSGFSMYSNLRVEPEYSNHLFMPASSDSFGYLSDTVRIVSSTDPRFAPLVGAAGERMPYISLCTYVARMDDGPYALQSEVTYERNGESFSVSRGAQLPQDCPGWWARKVLLFATVGEGAEKQCVW